MTKTRRNIFTGNISFFVNIIINDSKKQHYINFFHDSNTNLRKVWQGIKEIINIKSKNCSVPKCLVEKDKTITVSKDIAENFNSYFSTIASTILEERKYEGNKSFNDFLQSPLLCSLVFDLADEMEVLATKLQAKIAYQPKFSILFAM